ncbi:MAG: KOW domain-containing RNA-binding protein [Bacteroidales bacterium]|nr:KOW domain-containing RNA-binding protein [Bacteroidales bacterium]MCM1415452.1 KOW domain-containing RNA-binding protein [bacterium]MCM1423508.1 KOW domain-containing RNA-binding protein [bacterium]
MEESMAGLLATSKAGHDKDSVYVILREEGEYAYIADGEGRTVQKPKRKNKKHLQLIKKKRLPETEGGFTDIEIKRFIKAYLCERKEREERNVKG